MGGDSRERSMMGRREDGQGQFFYSFDLDEVVPSDHLVRQIDAVLDLGWVHKELAPYYSHTGRPSIDPVLMIRMLIVGYVFAIRSERRICAEVQVNLAYRWFCKLGIEDKIPDHSVFCRARLERFRESDALRRVTGERRRRDARSANATSPTPARQNSGTDTPLRIPYGNKEVALKLGAHYRSGGWYAPPGVGLAASADGYNARHLRT
jgi:transposase